MVSNTGEVLEEIKAVRREMEGKRAEQEKKKPRWKLRSVPKAAEPPRR